MPDEELEDDIVEEGNDGHPLSGIINKAVSIKIMLGLGIGCSPLSIIGGIIFFIILFASVISPLEANTNYVNDSGVESSYGEKKTEDWVAFKDTDPEKATFYKKLATMAKDYNDKYGIRLDVALISSLIFYQDAINPEDDNFQCDEEIVKDEEGNVSKGDCVSDTKSSKVSATKLYKEAKKIASAMVQDGRLISDDEFKVWVKNNYIEDKLKDMDITIPTDPAIKDRLFNKKIDEIFQLRDIYVDITYDYDNSNYTQLATCDYKVDGKLVRNVKVELLSCDGKKVLDTIDFDKYIKGVVMAENRGAPDEGIKAQAVVARSFALTRQTAMCPSNPDDCQFGYNAKENVIRMRSCENDQAYCDPEKGCTITEAINEEGKKINTWEQGKHSGGKYIAPLEGNAKKRFNDLVDSVSGVTVVNANGSVIYPNFTNVDQQAWSAMADLGKKYDQILLEYYKDKGAASLSATCSQTEDIMPGIKFPIAEKFYSSNCYSAGEYYPGGVYHGSIDFAHNALFAGKRPESDQIRIVASISGVVSSIGKTTTNTYPACMSNTALKADGLGYYIKVDDKTSKYNGYTFVYWHLSQMNPEITVGSKVQQGDYLGLMGNTGCSSGKHLHYQIIDDKGKDVIIDKSVDKYCSDHASKD